MEPGSRGPSRLGVPSRVEVRMRGEAATSKVMGLVGKLHERDRHPAKRTDPRQNGRNRSLDPTGSSLSRWQTQPSHHVQDDASFDRSCVAVAVDLKGT